MVRYRRSPTWPGSTDAALVDAAGGWARAENAACARKLAVMAEIFARRTGLDAGERELWWIDPDAAVAAEMARRSMSARAWRCTRPTAGWRCATGCPAVAALFEAGLVSDLLVRTIVWRTYLITTPRRWPQWTPRWPTGSPAGARCRWPKPRPPSTRWSKNTIPARCAAPANRPPSPTVEFGSPSDPAGTTSIWARLNSPDAVLIEQRVEELAHSVCDADPRGIDERRRWH